MQLHSAWVGTWASPPPGTWPAAAAASWQPNLVHSRPAFAPHYIFLATWLAKHGRPEPRAALRRSQAALQGRQGGEQKGEYRLLRA